MQFLSRKLFFSAQLLMGATLLYSIPQQAVQAQQTPPGIWEGVYTDAQVERGQTVYRAECVSCHLADLTGQDMSPSLIGVGFSFSWQGRSLQELYAIMRFGMPQTAPGSLSDQAYADITAFVLSQNGFPSGASELTTDEDRLALIEITSDP